MLKKTITYTDYDDNERTKTFYFNLTRAEIVQMQYGTYGGMSEVLTKIIEEQDQVRLIEMFKYFIDISYGEKSPDGDRFIKSPELSKAFSETEAYSILYMELATDANAAANFIKGISPKDLVLDHLPPVTTA